MGAKLRTAALACLACCALWACGLRPATAESVSPDGRWRVSMTELGGGFSNDRKFELLLEALPSGEKRKVFRSPDEGRPPTGRLLWSADSARFVLVGDSFFLRPGAAVPGPEQLYLMMEPSSGRIWCNASQKPNYPGFGPADLRDREWSGWTPPSAAGK